MFSERKVIELWLGALDQLFELARDECSKLRLRERASKEGEHE
jgi:hypothetical protein